jgi:hypothetical protein
MNDTMRDLPPDPSPGREDALQAIITVAIITCVMIWPEIIPVVSVILATIALQR